MFHFLVDNPDYPQVVISICSMLISVVAVLISLFTAISQIRFNKNSLSPFCHITFETVKLTSCIMLQNAGTGVMIAEDILYQSRGKCASEISDIINNFNCNTFLQWNYSKSCIAAGEKVKLVEIAVNNKEQLMALLNILETITVSVSYTDAYKRKKTSKLSLFEVSSTLKGAINAKSTIIV